MNMHDSNNNTVQSVEEIALLVKIIFFYPCHPKWLKIENLANNFRRAS